MNGFGGKVLIVAAVWAIALGAVGTVVAELADVYLKSGVKLRGDVSTTDGEVILRNTAGELRLPRAEVARVVPVTATDSAPSTPPSSAPAAGEGEGQPGSRPAHDTGTPVGPELPPAPPLTDEDIQRLKLGELRLDGLAEPVRVRFLRKGKQRDLATEVLEELKRRQELKPEDEEVLLRGQPYERLQLILRLTGLEHAERVVIDTDPAVFATFRRRVLPLVNKGCARSGCHSGKGARVFRFPLGSPTSDTYAYTSFVLLDEMATAYGPLLDRTNPEDSALLYYLMRPEDTDRGHPPVKRGPAFKAVIRDREDRQYEAVLDWINSLRVPRPEYGLKYRNPHAGRLVSPPSATPEPSPASQPQKETED